MGWQSGLLGGNVVSSYLHVDNLRNDLTAGKFWNATDGSETDFVQMFHSGNEGNIVTTSGGVRFSTANGEGIIVLGAGLTQYLEVSHDGTNGRILSSAGSINLLPANGAVAVYSSDHAKALALSHDGTNGIVNSNNGMLILTGGGDNRRVQIGTDAISNMRFRMQDNFTGAWVRAYVYNGAWVIESDS